LGACTGLRISEVPSYPTMPVHEGNISCLAMSGGGIRSGAVSLGALQGLHAANALSGYELISTVSGGGYPVYGLLDRMIRKNLSLADLLSESGDFMAGVDNESKFIGKTDIYAAAILGPTLWAPLSWLSGAYGAGRPTYKALIHRSFTGHSLPFWSGEPKLDGARDIRSRGFPTPIFGTSVSIGPGQPRDGTKYDFGHFFELSPTISGAPNIGYFSSIAEKVTLADAVAMSAAAIDTPQGELQLPAIAKAWNLGLGGNFYAPSISAESHNFYLADGGFIENLGLLPLIRRGCTEILAFDNSDDDSTPFDAWKKFDSKVKAGQKGWEITDNLRAENGNTPHTEVSDGWMLPDHIWDAKLWNGDHSIRIRIVKLGMNRDHLSAYPESVIQFAEENWGGAEPSCDDGEGLDRRCSFPLEATARQTFTKQEFRAYRHLGRWLAELALKTPRSN